MKNLFLIRHGKSSWDDSSLPDEERPLKKRGEKDAVLMAKVLRKQSILPELMVSSPAKRALTTARIIADEMDYDPKKIVVDKNLYFEGIENIMNVIHQLDNKTNRAFVFGHNPDFTELANHFFKKAIDNVPTCGVTGIEFKVKSWKEVSLNNGKLIFYDYPSNHR